MMAEQDKNKKFELYSLYKIQKEIDERPSDKLAKMVEDEKKLMLQNMFKSISKNWGADITRQKSDLKSEKFRPSHEKKEVTIDNNQLDGRLQNMQQYEDRTLKILRQGHESSQNSEAASFKFKSRRQQKEQFYKKLKQQNE